MLFSNQRSFWIRGKSDLKGHNPLLLPLSSPISCEPLQTDLGPELISLHQRSQMLLDCPGRGKVKKKSICGPSWRSRILGVFSRGKRELIELSVWLLHESSARPLTRARSTMYCTTCKLSRRSGGVVCSGDGVHTWGDWLWTLLGFDGLFALVWLQRGHSFGREALEARVNN